MNLKDYDAIFYVGGHGPVIDLSADELNAKLASDAWKEGKIVSAVCHGPAYVDTLLYRPTSSKAHCGLDLLNSALVQAVDASGKSIFSGRNFTGFSNNEEEIVGMVQEIPFLLEDKIKALGGQYEKASDPWGVSTKGSPSREADVNNINQPKVIVDGKLITGQNPASAAGVGEAILKAIQ